MNDLQITSYTYRPHDYYSTIEYNNARQVVAGCEAYLKTYKGRQKRLFHTLDLTCYPQHNTYLGAYPYENLNRYYCTVPEKECRLKHYE